MASENLLLMRETLASKQARINKRYKFYDMKNTTPDFGISTPPKLRNLNYCLGWCAKAVDALADRVVFKQFENDTAGFNEIASMNNPDIYFDSAVLEGLIGACSFTYIKKDSDGVPVWEVITANKATGIIDKTVGLLKEGYILLETGDYGFPKLEAHLLPFRTDIVDAENDEIVESYSHSSPYPLLVPHLNRPDSRRPFGHSQISRSCMDIVQSAVRTVKRSEISAEFYSFPQKYLLGTSDETEIEKWEAAMSAMMDIPKDSDGDKPTVGQFQVASQQPHIEQLRMFAAMFAGETGLTLDDLGFPSDNPSSAEAIKSQHENLRIRARKAQKTFGTSFINVGYLSACLRDNQPYERKAFYRIKPTWYPIFEPDSSMLSLMGDGAIKLNQAVEGYMDEATLNRITGIK